jgi:hypothetical protein
MKQITQNRIETISRNGSTFLPKGLFHTTSPAGSFSRMIPMSKQIKLTQGKYAIVDDDMFDYLNQWKWFPAPYANGNLRARRNGRKGEPPSIYMHRVIMGEPKNKQIDHRDRNGLNNQRYNLRICSWRENSRNSIRNSIYKTSAYKGVIRDKERGKWRAEIQINKNRHHIGRFETEIEAAKAYDVAAKKYHKEFAYLNFPCGEATSEFGNKVRVCRIKVKDTLF